jgi:hypothetical protein
MRIGCTQNGAYMKNLCLQINEHTYSFLFLLFVLEIVDGLQEGHKIAMIKVVRAWSTFADNGMGLKEAKELVEWVIANKFLLRKLRTLSWEVESEVNAEKERLARLANLRENVPF